MNTNATPKPHFLKAWWVLKLRARFALLTFFFILIAKQYYSKVRVEVRQNRSLPITPFQTRSDDVVSQFIAAQFEIIASREILYPIIDRLELARELSPAGETLSKEELHNRLKRAIRLQNLRNTGLIEIGVYDTDPDRAANIANSIAVVYRERRRADWDKNEELILRRMKEDVEMQRKAVENAKDEANRIRQQNSIPDPNPDASTVTPSYETLQG
jgi:capsular polysaccharide biosynthesis protein